MDLVSNKMISSGAVVQTLSVQAWELSVKTQISTAVKQTFCAEKKCVQGKEIGCKKEKEAPVLVPHQIWSTFTCSSHPSWSRNCEQNLLLLSWTGNRLERSHSYTLLRYVSAKKKRML